MITLLKQFAPIRFVVIAMAAALSACAGAYTKSEPAKPGEKTAAVAPANYTPPCAVPDLSAYECDRRSILAMAGEFRVHFDFDEVAALAPGYAPHAAQHSGGTELVLVIADAGRHISLQHILVLGKDHTVVKHWRQDWQFEPDNILRFRGNGKFVRERILANAATGAWSQTVYEVDDAPRYAGIGHWTHANSSDAWESDRTWRPLPRRDYTRRSDYQALDVVNRHTLTPGGWVHEQDNTKLAINADGNTKALVRERGINTYSRIADYDFGAGRDYWKSTQAFWANVRGAWERYEHDHAAFVVTPDPNGEARIDALFELADKVAKAEAVGGDQIDAVLSKYFSTP